MNLKLLALTIGNTVVKTPTKLPQPGNETKIISGAITIFMTAGIIASLISVIWAGIQWTSSSGDKQKLASARARLTWGIIGLVIILLAFFVINVFGYFFGVNLLIFDFSPVP